MSLPAAAARLRLDYRTIRRLIVAGTLRGGRSGHLRHWFVDSASVAAYLTARTRNQLDTLAPTSPSEEKP
jgi:excisionase family DNA binding protein